ncbi:hypothetical protein D3C74_420700 [compost metagenome]
MSAEIANPNVNAVSGPSTSMSSRKPSPPSIPMLEPTNHSRTGSSGTTAMDPE